MMNNLLKSYIFFSVLFCAVVQAAENPKTLPESNYPFWPSYQYLEVQDLDSIEAQKWISEDHVIYGWDWSLPDFVEPSPRSLVGLQRNLSVSKEFRPLDLKFKSNPTGILWVKWRDIEPTPGIYDFTPIINRIQQASSVGSDIILRILCHSKSRAGDISKGEAPLWLEDLGVNFLPQEDPKHNLNFDPSHPEFHKHYLMLVDKLASTGIPSMVKAAYVGYASHSFGDEGIGPYRETDNQGNDTVQHVRERLDAWENAFRGMEHKVFMGSAVDYGFRKGFGVRRGFVEMYLYRIPDSDLGQYVDENGYLFVDETAPVLTYRCFNGDVNEEYEEAWATDARDYRFGNTTNSYPYRYFTSTLRALQMRCTYIHTTGHLIPKMLPFLSLELGRTIDDTPDAWCALRESYLKLDGGTPLKNFERWLYQRDAPGYETEPALQIQHAIKMWMVQEDKYYDFIARKGKKMGFDVDGRMFPGGEQNMAVKVTFYDGVPGTLKLVYENNLGLQTDSVIATGMDTLRTATFFINARMDDSGLDHGFDFVLESEEEVPVAFVRVIKTEESYENTDQSPYGGVKRTIPGIIEGEHYDEGDPGFAYRDDNLKEGDIDFRPSDSVDVIFKAGASNDSIVSFNREGEWLEYTVDATTGKYEIALYYYCGEAPGELLVSLEEEVLDTIGGLKNQGWDTKDSVTVGNIRLTGGSGRILRLEFINGAGFDLDAIRFTKVLTPVSGIALTGCPTGDIYLGDTHPFFAEISPVDAEVQEITWNSSDTSVATVNEYGMVSAKSEGTATISVRSADGGFTDECLINVAVRTISVYGVSIGECPQYILETGMTHQLIAHVAPPDATDATVSWSSSNPAVANVDSTGLVTALSQGTTMVTLTTHDGGYTSTCSIGAMATQTGASAAGQLPEGVRVYPNPVSDKLFFKFPDSVLEKNVTICNPLSQVLIARTTRASHFEIDVGNLVGQHFLIVGVLLGGESEYFKVLTLTPGQK
jgi:hypothetical protein